jgi:hypothetical protein
MFIYQNNKKEICITFKDNKPVEAPEYILSLDADKKLIVNGTVVEASIFQRLAEDTTNGTAIVVQNALTINLNGHTISIPEDTDGSGVYHITTGGNLTINGDGVINGVGKNDYNMAIWADGGNITINGGTFTNKGATAEVDPAHFDLIYAKNGSIVEINGGEFICETPQWTLNNNDSKPGQFIVKGGRFFQFDPSNTKTEHIGANNNFVAEGYKVIQDGDWYEVIKA